MSAQLAGRRFVIDGSNLVFFHGIQYPQLRYFLGVHRYLSQQSALSRTYFDANTVYALSDHNADDARVFEHIIGDLTTMFRSECAPSGTPADIQILQDAKANKSEVISNDKFRDRARANPWIWKRRHAFEKTGDAILIPSLDASIELLPNATDYF